MSTSTTQDILESLGEPIEQIRIGWPYRLAIVAVAGLMVLLPLLYLGLIAATGYAVFWYATNPAEWQDSGWGLRLYLASLVAGATAVVFLIKPLFARHPAVRPVP